MFQEIPNYKRSVWPPEDEKQQPMAHLDFFVKIDELDKEIAHAISCGARLCATVENLVSLQSIKTGEAQGLSYDQIMEKYDGKLKEFYKFWKLMIQLAYMRSRRFQKMVCVWGANLRKSYNICKGSERDRQF